MDMSAAGPGIPPWLVTAVVLIVLVGGAALLALRVHNGRRGRPTEVGADQAGPGPDSDDLPAFLEFPPGSGAPGSTPAAAPPEAGWPSLATSGPPAITRITEPAGSGRPRSAVLTALTVTALLLLAAAVVLDPGPRRPGPHSGGGPPGERAGRATPAAPAAEPRQADAGDLAGDSVRPGRDGGAARLAFQGLVLERRAVGITATYPALEVTWNRDEAVAHLRLPTYNCLTAAAPEDPVAAGCALSVPEYADLSAPALEVTGGRGALWLSGRFPTYVRPNGSPPEWTERVYEFSVRAAPAPGEPGEGWVRAVGEIRLGEGRAPTVDAPDVVVLRGD